VNSKSVAKKLLGLIEKSAADAGEVYLQKSEGVNVEVRDQAVERLKNTQAAGYALRLIVDGRMAFVSSSDMRDESLESTVAKGVALAKHSTADESNVFAPPSSAEVDVDAYDESIDGISIDQKVNLLKDIETLCFAYDPVISKMEGVDYSDRKTETVSKYRRPSLPEDVHIFRIRRGRCRGEERGRGKRLGGNAEPVLRQARSPVQDSVERL
jgi:PmbA protein